MMEEYYHSANPFRWHLNVFLKALKEIPDLISMSLQNEDGFPEWFRQQRSDLNTDPLIHALSKHRDFIVHRSMLVPESSGTVGISEGRGFKAGINLPIHPLEDSENALRRYALHLKDCDFLGLLTPDEDSIPCVEREWRLSNFDQELVDLCAQAWLRIGRTIDAVLRWQGAEPPPLSLDCRHDSAKVRLKYYDRDQLIKFVNDSENKSQ